MSTETKAVLPMQVMFGLKIFKHNSADLLLISIESVQLALKASIIKFKMVGDKET